MPIGVHGIWGTHVPVSRQGNTMVIYFQCPKLPKYSDVIGMGFLGAPTGLAGGHSPAWEYTRLSPSCVDVVTCVSKTF